MKVLSLFAGIGGIDLGLEMLGWETVAFSEHDPKIAKKKNGIQYAAQVMQQRFPDAVSLGDITKLTFARNRENVQGVLHPVRYVAEDGCEDVRLDTLYKGDVDIICGGFPCQDISLAGKGAGIQEGTRSGLWRNFAEAIVGLRPRAVMIENVAALAGKGLDRVLVDLYAAGYDAEWDVISAAGVGAPHLRERLFILAWPIGAGEHGAWVQPPVFDNWLTEPDLPRLTTENVEQRTARLRCLGNAVVPQVAAWVASMLADRIDASRPNAGLPVDLTDVKHARGKLKGESKFLGKAYGWIGCDGVEQPAPIAGLKLPRAGRMTNGEVFERVRSCTQAYGKATGLKYMAATLRPRIDDHAAVPAFVPTPNAHVSQDGEGPETWLERRDEMLAKGYNGNGAGMPLSIYAQLKADPSAAEQAGAAQHPDRLVPTPTAKDADSSRSITAIRETPPERPSQMGETLTDCERPDEGGLLHATKLLPTPKATDGDKGVRSVEGGVAEMARGKGGDLNAAVTLLPTPRAMTNRSSRRAMVDVQQWASPSLEQVAELMDGTLPHEFEHASEIPGNFGRLIPTPTTQDAHNNAGPSQQARKVAPLNVVAAELEQKPGRLNPEWVGWLMGFPPDWAVS